MKISNKKIIVSTLALAMGAALAGSISGSVAWYQYSTRAAAQINGTTAGTIGDLQVKLDSGSFSTKAVSTAEDQIQPMSASRSGSTITYYAHPVYQTPKLPVLTDASSFYVEHTLEFKFTENGSEIADKPVYLSYFNVVKASAATTDFSGAVRVEFIGQGNHFLLSKTSEQSTDTTGNLDIGGATGNDKDGWDCLDTSGDLVTYINGTSASYKTDKHADTILTAAQMEDPYTLDTAAAGKEIALTGSTAANKLTVRIWLEGWEKVGETPSASWAAATIGQDFEVQMQFMCQADH